MRMVLYNVIKLEKHSLSLYKCRNRWFTHKNSEICDTICFKIVNLLQVGFKAAPLLFFIVDI